MRSFCIAKDSHNFSAKTLLQYDSLNTESKTSQSSINNLVKLTILCTTGLDMLYGKLEQLISIHLTTNSANNCNSGYILSVTPFNW